MADDDQADESTQLPPTVHAKITRSETSYSVHVASTHPYTGGMTIWALRDFLRAVDLAAIPDTAELIADRNDSTCAFIGLRVRHTFTVSESAVDTEQ